MQRRKRTRLRYHDYDAGGAYCVTICAARRLDFFGRLNGATVELGPVGAIVEKHLTRCLGSSTGVDLRAAVVMPDHVHAVMLLDGTGSGLSRLINAFKGATTREAGARIWQRGFYDHIVREEDDLERVCEYVVNNPLQAALRAG
jgi:REP element-mobilizing transposase RayT